MGQLEPPTPLPQRPGERPLFMAEQFRFQRVSGKRRTADFDERVLAAGAVLVDGIGDQLFARSALAQDQVVESVPATV